MPGEPFPQASTGNRRCWFCSADRIDESTMLTVDLHLPSAGNPREQVRIPTCASCLIGPEAPTLVYSVISCILGILGFVALLGSFGPHEQSGTQRVVGLALLLVASFHPLTRRFGPRPSRFSKSDIPSHPEVRELLAGGWKLGATPTADDGAI